MGTYHQPPALHRQAGCLDLLVIKLYQLSHHEVMTDANSVATK